MRVWWQGLQDRERLLVQLAAALAIAFLGWLLILRPLGAAKIRLTASVAQLQGQIGLAQTQTQAILAARNAGLADAAPRAGRSLMALTDASAREAGLSSALKRMQPEGENQVKVELEAADFDALVSWLERLDTREGIAIREWSVDRALAPGVVNARMTLETAR